MAKKFNIAAVAAFVLTAFSVVLYGVTKIEIVMTFAITFGTVAYHLIMRLLVSAAVNRVMRDRVDFDKRRYSVGTREMMFYKKIGLQKLKSKMPTYNPALFDPRKHSWEEIAVVMCKAEVVHETNAVLSFLPIVAGFVFGVFPVFIVTSVMAALFDMLFVMIQRYNRQRIVIMLEQRRQLREKQKMTNF